MAPEHRRFYVTQIPENSRSEPIFVAFCLWKSFAMELRHQHSAIVTLCVLIHESDAIRSLARTLGVSSDELLFGKTERGPDEDLRMQFEAISRFSEEEKKVVRSVLEGLLLTHEARRWASGD